MHVNFFVLQNNESTLIKLYSNTIEREDIKMYTILNTVEL